MSHLKQCQAVLERDTLVVRNSLLERRWRLVEGALQPTSIRDLAAHREWLLPPPPNVDMKRDDRLSSCPNRPAMVCAATLSTVAGKAGPTEEPSLVAELRTGAKTYRLQVFPDAAAIGLREVAIAGAGCGEGGLGDGLPCAAPTAAAHASGIEEPSATPDELPAADRLELLELPCPHLRLVQVSLLDQTDIHNELVFENEWLLHPNEALLELSGNLFIFEDPLTGDGLIWLKLAPLPHARPIPNQADLRLTGTGMCYYRPNQSLAYRVGLYGTRYPTALIAYQHGQRTAALHNLQRQFRPFVAGRDGLFLSNTWGDRSRDARINEPFLRQEVEAGARLGVEVVQIDDGWQRGRTSNSSVPGGVWEGFWATDANFWDTHPQRFPNGLRPVIELARARGMQFGLWFGPDSANDFAQWERDAAAILGLHRGLGVNYFKIDGVKARTAAGEENLRRFFDRVLVESAGKVVFDLDVTAEIRPGYFGLLHVGPLFVENRYSDFHRYWPHQTLRNLWKLARYIDPVRLRMEFLNNARNVGIYEDDPLAPARYSPAYLFATTMFASPLGWFEVSNLPASYSAQIAPLAARWKEHRDAIFSAPILPMGQAPDGTSWNGFHSLAGYALVFRERNQQPTWTLPVSGNPHVLAGNGTARVDNGAVVAEIPEPLNFLFLKL